MQAEEVFLFKKKVSTDIEQVVLDLIESRAETSKPVYRGVWKQFRIWIEKERIRGDITQFSHLKCQQFMNWYEKRPGVKTRIGHDVTVSQTTLKKVACTMSALYAAIFDELNITSVNPWKRVGEVYGGRNPRNRRPTELTPYDKIEELVAAPRLDPARGSSKIAVRDSALLAMLYGGALRRSEAASLNLCHVKINQKGAVKLVLMNTKNGDDVEQRISPAMCQYIRDLYHQRIAEGAIPSDPFLVDYLGRMHKPGQHRLCTATIYNIFKRYCYAVGLSTNITPHSARATAITYLLDKGIPHRDVSIFSRHSSIVMVEWYDKRRRDDELNPVDKLFSD